MTRRVDPDAMKQKQQLLAGYYTGLLQSGVVWLGLELGLFRALKGGAPATARELAEALALNERFVLEWLRAAAAGGMLAHHGDGAFSMGPEVETLLAEPENLFCIASMFNNQPERLKLWPRVAEAFRTGLGYGWDDRGPLAVRMMEETFGNWYRQVLVPTALPALDGVVERLRSGAVAADVGCGTGIALLEMAKAFPASRFHGYDSSANAIARANENLGAAGVTNASFHLVPGEVLPDDGSLSLVTTFDCMHDMTRPHEVAGAIRASLQSDGTWFIADINSLPTFEANLAENPASARMYPTSIFGCLQTGMSEPGGAGLGTFGLPEPAMRELAKDAGFTRFRRLDIPSPINAYYEARP
jgi:2-polyprenyl-3-methyl-5-hydroxy-6-metoxy-1,4-benzoquinol methylase